MNWLRQALGYSIAQPHFRFLDHQVIERPNQHTQDIQYEPCYVEVQLTTPTTCVVAAMTEGTTICRSAGTPVVDLLLDVVDFVHFSPYSVDIFPKIAAV